VVLGGLTLGGVHSLLVVKGNRRIGFISGGWRNGKLVCEVGMGMGVA